MEETLQVTFGVEMEFLVPFDHARYAGSIPEHDHRYKPVGGSKFRNLEYYNKLKWLVREEIIAVLRAQRFKVNDYRNDNNYENWTVFSDNSVSAPVDFCGQMTGSLDGEEYLWPEECSALGYADVEVKSRALLYCAESLEEVFSAIHVINENFPTLVNETSGLHVHIGNRTFGFPLQTVKNLAILVSVFENQFNSLHPPERLDNEYCVPPSYSLGAAGGDSWQIANLIDLVDSLEEVVALLGRDPDLDDYSHYKCYNFNNLLFAGEKKRTIEFRQHEGTMDPGDIVAWISLTASLVSLSHNTFADIILEIVLDHGDTNLRVTDLLVELGLTTIADYYRPLECSLAGRGTELKRRGFDSDDMDVTHDKKMLEANSDQELMEM
ncbi:hypothetical protein MMC09_000376 [Bachmanniomyces sp. S44760]|nr:hypothetical protein [Bachmanniomyces sp. S44760]